MSYELINRITVKKDGVYISSHSNNDTAPFHSHLKRERKRKVEIKI